MVFFGKFLTSPYVFEDDDQPQELYKVSFSDRLGAMSTTDRSLGMKANAISIKHAQRPVGRGHGTHSYINADLAVLL